MSNPLFIVFYGLLYVPLGPGANGGSSGGNNGEQTPAPLRTEGLELHFIIIIAVVGLLMVLVALDMICFCSRDFGILACICGSRSPKHRQQNMDMMSLDGGE